MQVTQNFVHFRHVYIPLIIISVKHAGHGNKEGKNEDP